jgi:hypothetical protein
VKKAVQWGLAHRDLSGIKSIGVDEIQWRVPVHGPNLLHSNVVIFLA